MKFFLHQVGDYLPDEVKAAVSMLDRCQTIWRFESADQIKKATSYDPGENLAVLPVLEQSHFFSIGMTGGNVTQDRKIGLINISDRRALISEYEWQSLGNYDPHEVFWAFALANICFQASINSCSDEYCLGNRNCTIEKLLLKLLGLHLCSECEKKLFEKYRYRVPEIRNLIEILRKPKEYGLLPEIKESFLPTFARQVRNQREKQVFQGVGIITVMHFLEDLIPFVAALISLGAREESLVLIVKPYPYSHKIAVHAYLRQHYPDIRVEYLDELPPSESLLAELVEYSRGRASKKKILAIEDGGYLVPFLHKKYSTDQNFCIGAVEQTTKGIRKDEELQEEFKKAEKHLYFPVLNVAKSKFKDEYESPLVGTSVVNSIQKILIEEHFSGKRALVVGFGAVGREVANALVRIGMIVKVYDDGLEKVAAARVRGFEAEQTVSEKLLEDVKLIIGTTGKTSINRDVLEYLGNGAILVSASSDRIEIDIDYLNKISKPILYKSGLGTYYVRKKGFTEERYLLLADGFPINFYYGSGIPTRSIDPVLAQLFIGAVHISVNHTELKGGIANIMDQLIKDYRLLEDFIDTYND